MTYSLEQERLVAFAYRQSHLRPLFLLALPLLLPVLEQEL
jgi:hypothetical protein